MSKNDIFWSPKNAKAPKIKRVVLSYDAHAKHFIEEKKKKQLNTAPEKVFEGYKGSSSQKTKTTKKQKKK